jgi:Na+/H+-dicarboxylate symporter
VLQMLLANMGLAPTWQYKNGANLITFIPKKKKPSQMVSLGIAILAALIFGGASYLLPENLRIMLSEQLISPIFNTFMGLLSAIAGPMIFLSVAWGIYSIGDTATLGKIGKKMISRFIVIQLILGIAVTLLYVPFFEISETANSSFAFSELFQMFLDIVPSNFFTPFTEGNPLQIIFVAAIVGLAMLILGHKTTVAASFVEQSNYIVQLIMETVSGMIPLFVFGSVLNMILGGNLSILLKATKVFPIMLIGMAVCVAAYLLLVSIRKKIKVVALFKKLAELNKLLEETTNSMK